MVRREEKRKKCLLQGKDGESERGDEGTGGKRETERGKRERGKGEKGKREKGEEGKEKIHDRKRESRERKGKQKPPGRVTSVTTWSLQGRDRRPSKASPRRLMRSSSLITCCELPFKGPAALITGAPLSGMEEINTVQNPYLGGSACVGQSGCWCGDSISIRRVRVPYVTGDVFAIAICKICMSEGKGEEHSIANVTSSVACEDCTCRLEGDPRRPLSSSLPVTEEEEAPDPHSRRTLLPTTHTVPTPAIFGRREATLSLLLLEEVSREETSVRSSLLLSFCFVSACGTSFCFPLSCIWFASLTGLLFPTGLLPPVRVTQSAFTLKASSVRRSHVALDVPVREFQNSMTSRTLDNEPDVARLFSGAVPCGLASPSGLVESPSLAERRAALECPSAERLHGVLLKGTEACLRRLLSDGSSRLWSL